MLNLLCTCSIFLGSYFSQNGLSKFFVQEYSVASDMTYNFVLDSLGLSYWLFCVYGFAMLFGQFFCFQGFFPVGIGDCIGFFKDIPLDFVFLVGLVNPI